MLEATRLRDNKWAVRPKGCLGTCGWHEGVAWTAVFVTAYNEREAIIRGELAIERARFVKGRLVRN